MAPRDTLTNVVKDKDGLVYYCPVKYCRTMTKSKTLFRQHISHIQTKMGTVTKDEENEYATQRLSD